MAAAEKFRSLLNYYFGLGRMRMSFGYEYKPANDFRWGALHTLHFPDGTDAYDGCVYDRDYFPNDNLKGVTVKSKQFEKFYKRIVRLNKKSSLSDVFWKGLVRYNSALDRSDLLQSFRDLWSVLEFLTNTGKNGYEITVKRASSLFKNCDYHREVLNHLRHRRNSIIHSGVDDEASENLMYSCKAYVEAVLKYIMVNEFRFRSHAEFGEFLDLPRDRESLSKLERQIKRALRLHHLPKGA
ncbi:hypothetical protein [Mesorhizobium sp.]|nr:hypothetical protein [Mesorhizobium sp.]RWB21269.1 MAG: hypothetical protein EOQ40_10740 [Mesorhizobium sp.]RWE00618.1 MAG: hypothetical protein EOS40_14595 [Mesorhizobium sp.]TIS50966.1 MAG: hypothetical protein E5W96_04655 [Mesorhizobium sp.]